MQSVSFRIWTRDAVSISYNDNQTYLSGEGTPRDIVISEFEAQLHYYLHFWTNTLENGVNPLILTTMGYILPVLFF